MMVLAESRNTGDPTPYLQAEAVASLPLAVNGITTFELTEVMAP